MIETKLQNIMGVVVMTLNVAIMLAAFFVGVNNNFVLGFPLFVLSLLSNSIIIIYGNPIAKIIEIVKDFKNQDLLTVILFLITGWIACIPFTIAFLISYLIFLTTEIKISSLTKYFKIKK